MRYIFTYILFIILSVSLYPQNFGNNDKDKTLGVQQSVNNVYTMDAKYNYKYFYTYNDAGDFKQIVKEKYILLKTYPVYRSTYTYNAENRLVMILGEKINKNNNWENNTLENYSYDKKGNISNKIFSVWENNTWVKSSEEIYTYNSNGKIDSYTLLTFIQDEVLNGQKEIYYYFDDSDYMEVKIIQKWDDKKDEFKNDEKIEYKRLKNGILVEEIHYINKLSSFPHGYKWYNDTKREFKYNIQLLLSKVTTYEWKDDKWNNSYRRTYEYDKHGNQTNVLYEDYNKGIWIPNAREISNYNFQNLLISVIYDKYDKGTTLWIHSFKETYIYDNKKNRTEYVMQLWNNSEWENNFKLSYAYNSYNNIQEIDLKHWNGSEWDHNIYTTLSFKDYKNREFIYNCYYVKITYNEVSEVTEKKIKFSPLKVFPNPASDYITVKTNLPSAAISISNLNGANLTKNINIQNSNGTMRVDVSGLAEGVYLIHLLEGGIIRSATFIVSR